jgi:hypothetical protein
MGTQINLGRALTAIEKTTRAGLTAETSSELRIDTIRRNEHQQVRNEKVCHFISHKVLLAIFFCFIIFC